MPVTGARLDLPAITDPAVTDHHPDPRPGSRSTETLAGLTRSAQSHFGLLVMVVSVLAVGIAAVNITHVSLWVDESYTVSVATRSLSDLWRMAQTIDIVHALYNAILHPWLSVVGVSELTVRLPSLMAIGAATAGVMVLARRLLGTEISVLAGLVFAVLPRVTWMGIEGRSYAATAAVAVWWTVLFVSLLRSPRWPKFVGYAVLTAFAGSLNIFLVLLVGAHGVTLLLDRRRRLFWAWLGAASAGVAATAPVLLTAIHQSDQIGPTQLGPLGYLRSVAVNQWFLGDTPTTYFAGDHGSQFDAGSDLWKVCAVVVAVAGWALIAYGIWTPPGKGGALRTPDHRLLLGAWLVLPTTILVGYSLVSDGPIYNPRYLSYGAPAVAILLAGGVSALAARSRRLGPRRSALALVGLLVVALLVPVYASQRTRWAKSGADWSGVARFITTHRDAPAQGVYYAPRNPGGGKAGAAGTTARTIEPIYPTAVAGLRDITLQTSPAVQGDLTGRSLPLAAATARLAGLDTIFMVRRLDYPAVALAADERVLVEAGFRPADTWSGPLNVVVEYVR